MLDNFQKVIEILVKIYVFYGFLCLLKEKKIINIDNLINESSYQKDQNFSCFQTQYKILALYFPLNYSNNNHCLEKNNEVNINISLIEKQINLAKSHGIFGFGVNCNLLFFIENDDIISNIFSIFSKHNFPFFLILSYDPNYVNERQSPLLYSETESKILTEKIQNYFKSEIYIKFKGKPILGISNFPSIKSDFIRDIRKYENENNKVNSFILSITKSKQNTTKEFDCYIEFPFQNIDFNKAINQKYFYNSYNYDLFKNETDLLKPISNFFIINGCQPEKFYILFKKFLNLTIQENNSFVLFNAWNNYQENLYLEPDEEFGFSYLNFFSKAIFNLNHDEIYNLSLLNNNCKIAVQVHIFYEDLIEYIINKTNNIPIKFDLYITITSSHIYDNLENYINSYSKCTNYEILIVENRGRDVLPFLNQMKNKLNRYKYICHMHSKKTEKNPETGFLWRNYLFNNLLGETQTVSEILYDFENNEKLGFIFPEAFYRIVYHLPLLFKETKAWMNFLFKKLFPNYQMGSLLNFPAGNMFWAKSSAIFQIFEYNFTEYFPQEDSQTENTIMHAIERIWLYLVKINGFYYKIIFKYF